MHNSVQPTGPPTSDSATLTLHLPTALKDRLGMLAEKTTRTRSFLAGEALAIIEGIQKGLDDMRAGRVVPHEVTLEPNDEEPVHHHRWPSVFVLDQIKPPVVDITPDGERLPPNRDVIKALEVWNGQGCLVVNMAPQPLGRVLNESDVTVHGIRIEMKNMG